MALTQISTAGVKDDAVTSGKIPANAVGSSELADDAVDTNAIVDDAVTADKLANSINTAIAANTTKTSNATHTGDVTGSTSLTIASNAVTTTKIADEAVTLAKLPHGTSSNNGKFLRANNGADPTFESLPASVTINNEGSHKIITSGGCTTLDAEGNLTFDGDTLSHGTGGLTNAQKLVIQGSNNSSGDALTLNNWGNSDGDYWTLGVNMTANSGGSFAKTDTNLRCIGVNIDGRMGRLIISASETSTSTITDPFTFNRNGDLDLLGNIVPVSGKGINFSATSDGSGNTSELLDDYEEGNWTPSMANTGSLSNGVATGKYTKVGRMVHFCAYLQWSARSNDGGYNITFGGLPFNAASYFQFPIYVGGNEGFADNYSARTHIGGAVLANTSGGQFRISSSDGDSEISFHGGYGATNAGYLYWGGTYYTE